MPPVDLEMKAIRSGVLVRGKQFAQTCNYMGRGPVTPARRERLLLPVMVDQAVAAMIVIAREAPVMTEAQ